MRQAKADQPDTLQSLRKARGSAWRERQAGAERGLDPVVVVILGWRADRYSGSDTPTGR
jgi:hypothetical protein